MDYVQYEGIIENNCVPPECRSSAATWVDKKRTNLPLPSLRWHANHSICFFFHVVQCTWFSTELRNDGHLSRSAHGLRFHRDVGVFIVPLLKNAKRSKKHKSTNTLIDMWILDSSQALIWRQSAQYRAARSYWSDYKQNWNEGFGLISTRKKTFRKPAISRTRLFRMYVSWTGATTHPG